MGLSIETNDLTSAGFVNEIFEDSAFGEVNYHTVNCFFVYILKSNDILKLDSQHSNFAWFDISDQKLHPLVKYRIEACLKVLS